MSMLESVCPIAAVCLLLGVMTGCANPEVTPGGEMKILCYNIRNCRGMDNQVDEERVARVIRDTDAEIVALQELDMFTKRFNIPVISNLAARVDRGYHCTFGPAIDYAGGKYGVGLLSKEVPLSVRQVPLPGRERRTLLLAEFGKYFFACTHLALEDEARQESARLIMEAVAGITKPLFLAGDMNAAPGEAFHKLIGSQFTLLSGIDEMTYPADKPKVCIDYIYGLNNGSRYEVLETRVLEEPLASDHRPVFAKVRLSR